MSEKNLIPELRFPAFEKDGEWTVSSIDKLCDILNNIRKPVTSTNRTAGPYPYYGASGIIDFIDKFLFDERLLLIGEDGAKWGAYDNTAFLVEGKYWVNNHAHVLKPIGIDEKLLESYLVKLDLNPYITGAAPPKLTLRKLKEIPVPVPSTPEEQQKIASCLSSLDELIAAHKDKLDALKDHKKGLLQNLFPQEGETVPKVRFPEFEEDGEWVEKKLGDFLLTKPEYGLNAPAVPYSEDLPTYLRITDISEDGNFLSESKVSVDRDVSDNDYLSEGDIVLARTGASVGKSYKYRKKDGNLVFAGFLIRVKPNPIELDSELLFQVFTTSTYWDWVRAVSVRSGQPGINGTQYANMPINLPPTIQEQQKIASCLSAVDELITAQQEKIEQLQQHKKGLMQGLFPKIES